VNGFASTFAALGLAFAWPALACAGPVGPIAYVDDNAPLGGDGTTWPSAFTHLQSALEAAQAAPGSITEIRIAQGSYRPDQNGLVLTGSGDRNATFHLLSGVAVRGGYLGLAATRGQSPDDRDIAKYQTILTGDLAGNDGAPGSFFNATENTYQVVTALNVDKTAVLDGVTITAGYADGPGFGAVPESREQGAGLNVYFAEPVIIDCTFAYNWNFNHGAINDHGHTTVIGCTFVGNYAQVLGAGLYIHHHSETVAMDCTFIGNITPGEGGGMYSRSMHHAMVMNCNFIENSATLGAGFWIAEDGNVAVHNCAFVGNTASLGGGMYVFYGEPMIEQCTFDQNTVIGAGGGMYCDFSDTTVMDCIFTGNEAPDGGGGMWNANGTILIEDCTFTGNTGKVGGGVYNGDFILPVLNNCTFHGNAAYEGGGCYSIHSDAILNNCTFISNIAIGGDFSVGGGASNYFSFPTLTKCIFIGNIAELGGGGVYNEFETPTITDCVFHGNSTIGKAEGWGGGMLNGYFTTPKITNCTFAGNSANLGGAMFNLTFSNPSIINCTMTRNFANQGAALYVYEGGSCEIANSILWDNSPDQLQGTVGQITYSCVQGGFAGAGNKDADPLFASSPDPGLDALWGSSDDNFGDLRLLAGSICIDAGDNTAVPLSITTDLAGLARYVDDPDTIDTGNAGSLSAVIDMGPYEFAPACTADIAPSSGNGLVDVDDLLTLINAWGTCDGSGDCDADIAPPGGNGTVDVDDLLTLINAWGDCAG
jgi:hypothetical protein